MRCPYCQLDAPWRALHAHLVAEHGDRVVTSAQAGRSLVLAYELACPLCEFRIRRIVNPRGQDPHFLDDNAAEIRLVAFDQLLYHVETAHAETPVPPAEER